MILVLDNIRSCYNVGAILRTAEGFGVEKVILSGYTPRVHDVRLLPHLREKLDREIHKTALGAARLDELKEQGWKVVGLENNISDVPLFQLNDKALSEKLSNMVVLILGEEVHGISKEVVAKVDLFVEIPMKGQKESFNVSVAAGIATYAIMNL